MRTFGFLKDRLKRLCRDKRFIAAAGLLIPTNAAIAAAAEKIAVFPTTPYDGYIVYESLAVFWIAIIGLIIIIRMKLREIERTQALGADRQEKDAPLLR
jgi:hypothetical protein